MATTYARDQSIIQQNKESPSATRGTDKDSGFSRISSFPDRKMASLRSAGPFDTPPRQQAGGSLSGFQSPYSPPTPGPRAPPAPIFTTPQRETNTQAPSSQTATPAAQTGSNATPAPETPKVGGKWTHPALQGIEKEARKFMFGEEDLKRLVVNVFLLYSLWWISQKVDDNDIFEFAVRYVRHSPKISLLFQIISWTLRALFLYNIARSLFPLVRPKSRPLTTIPLTPAQRELIGLDNTDITPIATTINETITPPRYKASPSGTRPSPRLTPSRAESPRSVSLGTPSPAQRQFTSSTTSSLGTFSTPVQQRPRSSSGLAGRKFASGVGGSPLGIGGSPLGSGAGMLSSPSSRKASMEVFFRA